MKESVIIINKLLKIFIFILLLGITTQIVAQTNIAFSKVDISEKSFFEMSAETVKLDQESGITNFFGNVKLGYGSLKIEADEMEISFSYGENLTTNQIKDQKIKKVIAKGNVFLVNESNGVRGDNAIYNLEKNTITLDGNVLILTGENTISGNSLIIDLNSGSARITGSVKSIFLPKPLEKIKNEN